MKTLFGLCGSIGLSVGLFACTTSDPIGTLIFEDAVREPDALEDRLEEGAMATPRVIAGTEHGHLVLIDATSGSPLDRLKLPTEGEVMDVATVADPASPWGVSHVYALVSPGEEELAQLFAMDWSEGVWGTPERIARFGGETRIVGTSLGALVMQREDGARWRLARLDKEHVPSTPCPMPQSVMSVTELGDGTVRVGAIAFEDDALVRVTALVSSTTIECVRTPIALARPASRSVRGVTTLGADVLVDAEDGVIVLTPLDAGSATGPSTTVLTPAGRIEDVVPLTFDRAQGFVAITSEPPSLVVVELGRGEGGALSVASISQSMLTGTPREVGHGFTRIAAMNDAHGALVTSAGLTTFALNDAVEPVFGETTAFVAPIVALDGAD